MFQRFLISCGMYIDWTGLFKTCFPYFETGPVLLYNWWQKGFWQVEDHCIECVAVGIATMFF